MFNAYKRFFAFAGKQKKTWYKGMGYELLRSIFEAIQFIALLVVLRALVEQNVTGRNSIGRTGRHAGQCNRRCGFLVSGPQQ